MIKIQKTPKTLIDNCFESYIIPMMNMFPKLVLCGSYSLNLLKIIPRGAVDFDFALKEKLTLEELTHLKDFFDLEISYIYKEYIINDDDFFKKIETTDLSKILDNKIIQFFKDNIKIDIFNSNTIVEKGIFNVNYNNNIIQIQDPSITLMYKAKILFQTNNNKHRQDILDLLNKNQNNTNLFVNYMQIRNILISQKEKDKMAK